MKLTTFLCFFVLLIGTTFAQEKDKYGRPPLVPGIAELKIGDQVPDILIDKIINNDKRSIRTSDYKDKLLVLDFWDTTCKTCIESMPKLDSLQKVFGDQMKLLSVTYQQEEMISKFFKNSRYLNERTAPVHQASVVEDRILRSYFRYQTNPHVVWINKGKVVAITGGEYITSENIQTLLAGKHVNWALKNDNFDPKNTSLMQLTGLSEEVSKSPYYSYSVLTGMSTDINIGGIGGINYKYDKVSNQSRIAVFNQDIFTTYQMLLYNTKPDEIEYAVHPGRIVIEVKEPSRIIYKPEYGNQSEWYAKNSICYEIVKRDIVDQVQMSKLAVKDLNNRLNLDARYEMRNVKCLVFVKTEKPITDTLALDKGGKPMLSLVFLRLDYEKKFPPAIDETGFAGGLRMEPDDGTIAGLRKEMQRHGLDLIEAEREIEVLVISDAKQ